MEINAKQLCDIIITCRENNVKQIEIDGIGCIDFKCESCVPEKKEELCQATIPFVDETRAEVAERPYTQVEKAITALNEEIELNNLLYDDPKEYEDKIARINNGGWNAQNTRGT